MSVHRFFDIRLILHSYHIFGGKKQLDCDNKIIEKTLVSEKVIKKIVQRSRVNWIIYDWRDKISDKEKG